MFFSSASSPSADTPATRAAVNAVTAEDGGEDLQIELSQAEMRELFDAIGYDAGAALEEQGAEGGGGGRGSGAGGGGGGGADFRIEFSAQLSCVSFMFVAKRRKGAFEGGSKWDDLLMDVPEGKQGRWDPGVVIASTRWGARMRLTKWDESWRVGLLFDGLEVTNDVPSTLKRGQKFAKVSLTALSCRPLPYSIPTYLSMTNAHLRLYKVASVPGDTCMSTMWYLFLWVVVLGHY